MTVALKDLLNYLEGVLQPEKFRDYCPNGLQVEGRPRIAKLATGVTACQEFLDAAIEWGADAVLVHHGYFWEGEKAVITGMKRRRLATLLSNDVSLLAYHLPLDAHPELGNNAQLGKLLGITPAEDLRPDTDGSVGNIGSLDAAIPAAELARRIQQLTDREVLVIGDSAMPVQRVAWCTGAAQGYIEHAVAAGADVYITGEVSEQTVHVAREEGIVFMAAGHHATERYGVQAVGEHLAQRLDLDHCFFDINNPA